MKMTSKNIQRMSKAELKERETKYQKIMLCAYWYDFIIDSIDEINESTKEEIDMIVDDCLRLLSSIALEHSEYPSHEIMLYILSKAQTKVATLLKKIGTKEQWNVFIDILEQRVDKRLILFER